MPDWRRRSPARPRHRCSSSSYRSGACRSARRWRARASRRWRSSFRFTNVRSRVLPIQARTCVSCRCSLPAPCAFSGQSGWQGPYFARVPDRGPVAAAMAGCALAAHHRPGLRRDCRDALATIRAAPPGPAAAKRSSDAARDLGIASAASDSAAGPPTTGPTIASASCSHELAHIRRGDWLIQMLAASCCAALLVQPVHVDRLPAPAPAKASTPADDAVLRAGIDGSEYASHLLELARASAAPSPVGPRAGDCAAVEPREESQRHVEPQPLPHTAHPSRDDRDCDCALTIALPIAVVFGAAQVHRQLLGTLVDAVGGVLPDDADGAVQRGAGRSTRRAATRPAGFRSSA